jgi:hypothetical protein
MLLRWVRKVTVLALAALGIQYLRTIFRVIVTELHPRPLPLVTTARTAAAGTHPGSHVPSVPKLTPQRLVITTLEPHGVL